jgi:hypothetical protein
MSESLFDPQGPETRNVLAEAFEDQLIQMGSMLGWREVCRNVDVVIQRGQPSRGIDVLWAVPNPWSGDVDGWFGEAKRKKDATRYKRSELHEEIQTLRDKVARLRDNVRFYNDPVIKRARIRRLVGGLVGHRSDDFPEEKVRHLFRNLDFQRNEERADPTRVGILSPHTLIGIADCFNHAGLPRQFLWPQSAAHEKHWTAVCPPEQLAVGLVAYRTVDKPGRKVLWVRGGLDQRDIEGFRDLVFQWDEKFDVVAFTDLNQDQRMRIAKSWRDVADESRDRPTGWLPSEITALDSQTTMKEFDQLWPGG